MGGFANLQGMRGPQQFCIHRAYTDIANLPTAHTCFNQVKIIDEFIILILLFLLINCFCFIIIFN